MNLESWLQTTQHNTTHIVFAEMILSVLLTHANSPHHHKIDVLTSRFSAGFRKSNRSCLRQCQHQLSYPAILSYSRNWKQVRKAPEIWVSWVKPSNHLGSMLRLYLIVLLFKFSLIDGPVHILLVEYGSCKRRRHIFDGVERIYSWATWGEFSQSYDCVLYLVQT